jgi:gliding motility-associated-like protein
VVTFQLEGAGADNYQVVWTDPAGTEISTEYSVTTGVAGLHRVMVTNPITGCTRQDSVLVEAGGANVPIVAFRQNSLELTCENSPVWLDGAPSSQGDIFTYMWETVEGAEQPNMQGNDSLRVRTAGIYRLTVLNTETNCTNSRDVIVTDPRIFPEVNAVAGSVLDCDNRETTIGINIVDQPNDFSIQWFGPAGITGLPRDTNRILVINGGAYNAVVINPTTSCVTTITIRVEDLIDSIATIAIMTPDSFDCNNTTITIDASGTDLNGTAQENITWTSFNGNAINPPTGSLIVSVNGPGDYELAITDGSGCTIRDTVRVEAANDTPFAQAGADLEIECGDMPQLDGSASTPTPMSGILYEWTAIGSTGTIISGADTQTPFVSGEGVYQLVVSNLNNGCADTATTTVTLSDAVAADAGTDFSTCDPAATLTGNLPTGTTGVWTAFNDEGSVWIPSGNTAIVSEVANGLSLVWTLSAGAGCENYSADTVRISPEDSPVANNDVLEVGGVRTTGTVDLLQNDQRTGPVTVTLLGMPSFGEILSNLNGTITFEAPTGLTEQTTIEYEVCSNACPDLCSRATLTIFSEAAGTDPTVYNAISPNGDGMNDVFYFEKLGRNPADFPENEMIIFNRWGDIIFDAKPYTNDWDGTSNGGSAVPEGTYYYVLRLNVGEGEIIRGDVTVIR